MASTSAQSKPSTDDAEGVKVEAKAQPVEHSLLKKGDPDEMLLTVYRKVEKKLAGPLKKSLMQVTGAAMELELIEGKQTVFADWLSGQEIDSVYLQYQFGVCETPIWIRVNRLFLTACVDCFFGGQFDGQTSASGKLKRSEIGMIERVAEAVRGTLVEAWSAVYETTVRFDGFFHDKDEIEMALEDGNALIAAIDIELSDHKIAAFDFVQTLDGLIAIEPQLNRTNSRDVIEIDPIWQRALKDSVEEVFLPVRSVLARPTMQLSELARLAVGDILPVAPTDNVPLIVGDRVFAHGSIGEQNGGVAFQIKNFL